MKPSSLFEESDLDTRACVLCVCLSVILSLFHARRMLERRVRAMLMKESAMIRGSDVEACLLL